MKTTVSKKPSLKNPLKILLAGIGIIGLGFALRYLTPEGADRCADVQYFCFDLTFTPWQQAGIAAIFAGALLVIIILPIVTVRLVAHRVHI